MYCIVLTVIKSRELVFYGVGYCVSGDGAVIEVFLAVSGCIDAASYLLLAQTA